MFLLGVRDFVSFKVGSARRSKALDRPMSAGAADQPVTAMKAAAYQILFMRTQPTGQRMVLQEAQALSWICRRHRVDDIYMKMTSA